MKKRLLSFILLLFAGITAAYAYDFSAVAPTGQTLYYNIASNGGTPEVSVTYPGSSSSSAWSAYTQPTGGLTIPSTVTYGGTTYSVTSIWYGAFKNCSSLTSVTIPNSITSIEDLAFSGCNSLASVTIPNSVIWIYGNPFAGCSGLTSIIVASGNTVYDSRSNCNAIIHTATNTLVAGCQNTTIPNTVTSIWYDAFGGCSNLASVTIPNSVTLIGEGAFEDCSSLASVTIPNSVTEIGQYAFSGCNSLVSVSIPNSVTEIGWCAFGGVRMIYYYGNAIGSPWLALCRNGYIEDSLYYTSSAKVALTGAHPAIASTSIPNSVTSIGDRAFSGCSSLASVTIPNSVTSIGNWAFNGCNSLASVTIPNSVTSIGDGAFRACSSLSFVTIPNSVTSIGSDAFYQVDMIHYYGNATGFPWGARCVNGYIEDSLYYTSSAKDTLIFAHPTIVSASIPNSVTTIGKNAFSGCNSLTTPNTYR